MHSLVEAAALALQSATIASDLSAFHDINDAALTIAAVEWRVHDADARGLVASLALQTHRVLLGVATLHIPRATPEKGVRFAERALDIAVAFGFTEEKRRGFNVCSALYVLTGAAADAVEYGLMAASIAKELDYHAAVVNSLANVNAALLMMGLHEDAVEIADRVDKAYANCNDCTQDLALVLTNAAKAALVLKRYAVAERYARRALDGLRADDEHDAGYRLLNEFTRLQCAMTTEDADAVSQRMGEIHRIAERFPTQRNDLNRRFAAALYVGHTQKAHLATIGQLGYLTAAAAEFTPIYSDVLLTLANLCSHANDHRSALFYAGELVDTVGNERLGRVRNLIAEIGQFTKPVLPQKNSAQALIDRIVAQTVATQKSPMRIEVIADNKLMSALERMAATAELCDDPSRRAIYRVGKLSALLARELGYNNAQADALERAARLHDIGKLGIPSAILAKPLERLTESEYLAMWRHATMGAQILQQCDEPLFDLAADIAHAHHESWDGTGYPRNLQGEEIHEAARIVCLAENYDSMTHARSYRHRMTHPQAVAYLSNNAGSQFDPAMTPVFIRLLERLRMQHGERMNEMLETDAPANREHLADATLLQHLDKLVPHTVFSSVRGNRLGSVFDASAVKG